MLDDEHVAFIKGKVVEIEEDSATHNLHVTAEDTLTGERVHAECDLAVLATGVVPNTADAGIPGEKISEQLNYDEYGFLSGDTEVPGVFVAGCAQRPCDVSRTTKEATAAALKAIQYIKQGE
jgi:quinone-modifying oxidoreductase subunit QmoA